MSELRDHIKFNIKQPKILLKDVYFNLISQMEKHTSNFIGTINELDIDFTLFLTGKCVEQNLDKIKELGKRFEIGTHGYLHVSYDLLKDPKGDLMKSIEVLRDIGITPVGFRPPSLWDDRRAKKLDIYKIAAECGIKYISSSTDKKRFLKHGVTEIPIIGEDWDLLYRKSLRSPDKISKIWLKSLKNDGVFVFHPHLTGRGPYLKAFKNFVEKADTNFVFAKDLLKGSGVALTSDISAFSRKELMRRIIDV